MAGLVLSQQELSRGVDSKIPWRLSAGQGMAGGGDCSGLGIDLEGRDRVMAAIAAVDEATVGMNQYLRSGVLFGRKIIGSCGRGADRIESALIGVPASCGQSGVDFVDDVREPPVGMKS